MTDIADSTMTVFQIASSEKLRLFYYLFISEMSDIAVRYEARVVKNAGDGVICYFPRTKDLGNKLAFKQVVDCGLEMIRYRNELNTRFQKEGLPTINYRVSADFGKHEMSINEKLEVCDIFSSTMNICSKIKLGSNQLVIGSDLYEIVKVFSQFSFKQKGEYSLDPKRRYPIFLVSENDSQEIVAETQNLLENPLVLPRERPIGIGMGPPEQNSRKGGEHS
jgi:class 3 adenylate cyclase